MKKLFFLFLTLLSFAAHAEKKAFVIGGVGADDEMTGFFHDDFTNLSSNLKERGWDVSLFFDGDKYKVGNSIAADFKQFQKKIDSTKLKKGDEALLVIHTHGASKDSSEKTHSVATSSGGSKNRSSVDNLEDQVKALEAKGIKVTVVDLSCYSGNTQNLDVNNDNSCVVTLGAKNYVTICSGDPASDSFTGFFIQALKDKSNKNIEDAYLNARKKDSSTSNLPAISSIESPNEKIWQSFLEFFDPSDIKSEGTVCLDCLSEQKFSEAWKKLSFIPDSAIRTDLQIAGKEYELQLQDLAKSFAQIQNQEKVSLESFAKSNPEFASLIKKMKSYGLGKISDLDGLLIAVEASKDNSIETPRQLKLVLEDFYKDVPQLIKLADVANSSAADTDALFEQKAKSLERYATKVMAAERKTYDLTKKDKGTNGCRNFQL